LVKSFTNSNDNRYDTKHAVMPRRYQNSRVNFDIFRPQRARSKFDEAAKVKVKRSLIKENWSGSLPIRLNLPD